jgi:hypothetical protein
MQVEYATDLVFRSQAVLKPLYERLHDEHGYAGGITIIRDYVRGRRLQQREVFVPLQHDPGHAQVDFARP